MRKRSFNETLQVRIAASTRETLEEIGALTSVIVRESLDSLIDSCKKIDGSFPTEAIVSQFKGAPACELRASRELEWQMYHDNRRESANLIEASEMNLQVIRILSGMIKDAEGEES